MSIYDSPRFKLAAYFTWKAESNGVTVATSKMMVIPPTALKVAEFVEPVKTIELEVKLVSAKEPLLSEPERKDTLVIVAGKKFVRFKTKVPVAGNVLPEKLKMICELLTVILPNIPDELQLLVFGPTQKLGPAGATKVPPAPNGVIVTDPVSEVLKV
jgi:hypothetical protein